jgi:trehalose-phosphatase
MVSGRCARYLFENIDEVANMVKGSRYIFLFLDYDGTLSPIPRRKIVLERSLSPYTKGLLAGLSSSQRIRVSIVSGRSVEALKRMIGLDGIYYIGAHGHVIEGPGIRFSHCVAEEFAGLVRKLLSEIGDKILGLGAVIEDKGTTFSIHYRGIGKREVDMLRSILADISSKYHGLKIKRGKRIFEVLPDTGWDKGKAVGYMIAMLSARLGEGLPIYIGDDVSDESAFKAVSSSGVSIRVGSSCRTNAQYYVKDVNDVEKLLAWLKNVGEEKTSIPRS